MYKEIKKMLGGLIVVVVSFFFTNISYCCSCCKKVKAIIKEDSGMGYFMFGSSIIDI